MLPEPARAVIAAQLATGRTIEEITGDPVSLERMIVAHHVEVESEAPIDEILFLDRGIPDNIAYAHKFGLVIDADFKRAIDSIQYRKIFLLDMIDYKNDAERSETPEEAAWLHQEIGKTYEDLGYDVVQVPVIPVAQRADFVLARL